ncbi:MAG: hypothetical protein EHM48_04935, partial [Planctomycetaceae bacterium]
MSHMEGLFPKSQEVAEPVAAGRVVGVAVATNVWRTFDYLWPAGLGEPSLGQRVRVPFGMGNRKTLGFVVDLKEHPQSVARLKSVTEVIDEASQFDDVLWKLGDWISKYYLTPLGMTLAAMIPSAVGKHAPKEESVAFLAAEHHDWPAKLGLRQKNVLDELLEARKQGVEPITLEQLLHHSGSNRGTIRSLVGRQLIRLETREVRLPELTDESAADPFELNEDQQAVLKKLDAKLGGGFSVSLLHGVTGSGKT